MVVCSIVRYSFRKSTYKSYKNYLQKQDIDNAVLTGRYYYLSLSSKGRRHFGIYDMADIDARIKKDIETFPKNIIPI